jgi:hypothetical protein
LGVGLVGGDRRVDPAWRDGEGAGGGDGGGGVGMRREDRAQHGLAAGQGNAAGLGLDARIRVGGRRACRKGEQEERRGEGLDHQGGD